jgi:hypothetical protein
MGMKEGDILADYFRWGGRMKEKVKTNEVLRVFGIFTCSERLFEFLEEFLLSKDSNFHWKSSTCTGMSSWFPRIQTSAQNPTYHLQIYTIFPQST